MIADLHVHLSLYLAPSRPTSFRPFAARHGMRGQLRDAVRAALVKGLGRWLNTDGYNRPRVSIPLLREGDVGIACCALYSPFDEMALSPAWHVREIVRRGPRRYYATQQATPPDERAFVRLMRQLRSAERHAAQFADFAAFAHDSEELSAIRASGRIALVHAVEGAFHLGADPHEIRPRVARLARAGVAYMTVAHLFYRSIAGVAPAIPFLSPTAYQRLWPQPDIGLADLGERVVEAIIAEGLILDLSHLNERALEDTFTVLDRVDPEHEAGVIASHVGVRFGSLSYNLDERTIERIAGRGGVIGLIAAEHQLMDGLQRSTYEFDEAAMDVLGQHIERVHQVTGSHGHTAIGTDLGGFIRPRAGLDNSAALARLDQALQERYGGEAGRQIAYENVERLLRTRWRVRHR